MTGPEAVRAALTWLDRTYGGRVELAGPMPVAETAAAFVFAARLPPRPGHPPAPMLTAAVAVPRRGATPFHLATADPLGDLAEFTANPAPRAPHHQALRTNARGSVLAVDAAVDGYAASAMPWRPEEEVHGWWERLVGTHFPGAAVGELATWDEVVEAVADTGPDTRGVVWIRRELGGFEFTGHLVYAHNNDGQVILLDGQTGELANLEVELVRGLVLARFHRARPAAAAEPWRQAAPTFADAFAKATAWLDITYAGELVLTDPSPADELARGWLFACSTTRYAEYRDWRDQTLDGALVVPKDDGAPFGLPSTRPWQWLGRWDRGEVSADEAPEPGPAYWYADTMPRLGPVLSASVHPDAESAIATLAGYPTGARALVWIRRLDERRRESVGALLTAAVGPAGLMLFDGTTNGPGEIDQRGLRAIHIIRYR